MAYFMVVLETFTPSTISTSNSFDSEFTEITSPRDNITFILGDDYNNENPYYFNTEQYFKFNDKAKTKYVVTSCRSLKEVQEYLIDNAPKYKPWGHINLVSHGNQYLGLSVKVLPEGKRSNSYLIKKAIEEGSLTYLTNNVVDEHTSIAIHGCGIGNNDSLLLSIRKVFSSANSSPILYASRYFEYFVRPLNNPDLVKKCNAKFWTISYKKGYKPNDLSLTRKFSKKYPDSKTDWREALKNTSGSDIGDIFSFSFDVPVKWIIKIEDKDSIPDIGSKKARLAYINSNERILKDIQKLELKANKFNWWFRKVYIKNSDGSKSPALWIKGYSTIHCILELMPEDDLNYARNNN